MTDVGLISLHNNFTIPNIPSKALDYWNVGIPILGSLDKATDFGQILDETKTGFWAFSGEHEKLLQKLLILYENKKLRENMKTNGRKYFKNNLLPEIAYKTVIDNL